MTAKELIRMLKLEGFKEVRQKGSHLIMKHSNGRQTTVPVHNGELKKGTERAILKEAGLK